MASRTKNGLVFLIFAILTLLLVSCGKKETGAVVTGERIISAKTDGYIDPAGPVTIIFQKPQVEESGPAEKNPFSFEPNIKGRAIWKDQWTLVLELDHDLKPGDSYEGFLSLKDVTGQEGVIPLSFTVGSRAVRDFTFMFRPVKNNDAANLNLDAEITFNASIDVNDIKKGIMVELAKSIGSTKLDLTVEPVEGKRNSYKVQVPNVQRKDFPQDFTFTISKDQLALEQDWKHVVTLPKMGDFLVAEIKRTVTDTEAMLSVVFSDIVTYTEGLERFIQVTPAVDFEVRTSNNTIILVGNFAFGTQYNVEVLPGIMNIWGIALADTFRQQVELPELDPRIRFSASGTILPQVTGRKVAFQTANVRRVRLEVKKIYANNLIYFLQDYNLPGARSNSREYWSLYKVGESILTDSLDIGPNRNAWLQSELDLSTLIPDGEKGVYIIEMSAEQEDLLADIEDRGDYWSSWYYLRENCYVVKPIIVSDIGIISKREKDGYRIFTTNIPTGAPLSNVEVKVHSYNNQVLASGRSSMDGSLFLNCDEGFAVTAERSGDRSVLLINDDRYNTSVFDVGGVTLSDEGLKGFTYTDRGVYRPGDSIHVGAIIRNEMGSFPENHPIEVEWYNPLGSLVERRVIREGHDGFYTIHLATQDNAPTGSWRLSIRVGESVFQQIIKVETIVPYRLKVAIETTVDKVEKGTATLPVTLESNYLFGAPSSNLPYTLSAQLVAVEKKFNGYDGYIFFNPSVPFERKELGDWNGVLSSDGVASQSIRLPEVAEAPSGVSIRINAEVSEKGGRGVPGSKFVEYGVYDVWVGLNVSGFTYRRTGVPAVFNAIVLDNSGRPMSGRTLHYRIYHRSRYDWYDYDSENWRVHYKSDESTVLVQSGTLMSSFGPVPLSFVPEEYGAYFVEIGLDDGHSAGYFFRAGYWGSDNDGDVGMVSLTTDRESYSPGQTANISGNFPEGANLLVSVEKGMKVLFTKWVKAEGGSIPIHITDNMAPNAYAVVTSISPYNDLNEGQPIRLYGIVPLMVEDPDSRLNVEIDMPEKLAPEQEFTVKVRTGKPSQVTIAIVDEGILDITRFQSPSPWDYFYGKEALSVWTSDMYDRIIGPVFGDIYKVFSIGGGMAEMMLDQDGTRPKTKRFKSVALFRGVVQTGSNGVASFDFKMPNYLGSVRAMAVAATGESYGMAEKTVPVTAPIVILPTIPRVLGPMDKASLPVTVFATEDGLGKTDVSIKVTGLGNIIGVSSMTLNLPVKGDTTIYFDVETPAEIGEMKIEISARSGSNRTVQTVDLPVRASGIPMTTGDVRMVEAGKTVELRIPDRGVKGTNKAWLTVNGLKSVSMGARLNWLIDYPYGCIEQTVSAVFPQLYLKEVMELSTDRAAEVDKNLNAAIARLSRFQRSNGGFSYWPDGTYISDWGSIYAGHFMIEAKNKGYHIPDHLFSGWLRYQKGQSRAATGTLLTRTYRLYCLALCDEADIGSMNVIRENALNELSTTARWYLAAAYALAGREKIAQRITAESTTDVTTSYDAFDPTFGSQLRDKAIVLEMLTVFDKGDKGLIMYNELADALSDGTSWYSTQTTAYALVAMGKYLAATGQERELKGFVTLSGKGDVRMSTKKPIWRRDIETGFGETAVFKNEGDYPVFVELGWSGVPLRDGIETAASKLSLGVSWLSEEGNPINISNIEQGTEFYGVFRVKNPTLVNVENVALSQLLPAGWEIENQRLSGEETPSFIDPSYADYMDIRDDGIYWFFNLSSGRSATYAVKLRAVTPGSFYLPATFLAAMYDNSYRATVAGRDVQVKRMK